MNYKNWDRHNKLVVWYIANRDRTTHLTSEILSEAAVFSGYSARTISPYLVSLRDSEHEGQNLWYIDNTEVNPAKMAKRRGVINGHRVESI